MPRLKGGLYGLKADPSARAYDQDCRHGFILLVGSAWLTVICDAGSCTARWRRLETHFQALWSSAGVAIVRWAAVPLSPSARDRYLKTVAAELAKAERVVCDRQSRGRGSALHARRPMIAAQ
jgi:hypothetical protein